MYSVIGADAQTYGPVELDAIRTWCADGRITADTWIVDPIDGQKKRAVDLPEVAQHLTARKPPTQTMTPPPDPRFRMPNQAPIQNYNYSAPYQQGAFVNSPPKSKLLAIVLAVLLGGFGIHRFYLGHITTGIVMLVLAVATLGFGLAITAIWALVDIVLIATGALRDGNNRPLTWP
jgi:TM2 domain-containing membrane protein YozV